MFYKKCSNGCEEEYEWIRPSLEISHLSIMKNENPLQQKLDKENIFDRLVITDFDTFEENNSFKYVPRCPKCGSSSESPKTSSKEIFSSI